MKIKFLIPSIVLSLLAPSIVSAEVVLFELNFPYASKWTNPVSKGMGNGLQDLDFDGQQNDATRGIQCNTPSDPEYLGTQNFTNAGPEIFMRGVLAHMDAPHATPPKLSSHGITKQSIRLEGTRSGPTLTSRMAYAGWWYVPSLSFANGGFPASFAGGGQITSKAAGNSMGLEWRVMVKSGGKYYVSETVSTGGALSISDIAMEGWSLYRHAEGGLSMRLKYDPSTRKAGYELDNIEGVGIYAQLIGFDGTIMGAKDRVLLDVQELTVTLN